MSDRTEWESRYRERGDHGIQPPSSFLVEQLHTLPRGRALEVACGDGRNALHLARHGWRVDAIDFAHAGLARLLAIGRKEALSLDVVQADLNDFPLAKDRYEVVINVRYLQRSLVAALKASLRPGGTLLFETFILDQRELGHPRNPDFLLERGELAAQFADLEQLHYEEGRFETESGPAFLARLLARRR